MAEPITLPEGFVLDQPESASLPPGFVLDSSPSPEMRQTRRGLRPVQRRSDEQDVFHGLPPEAVSRINQKIKVRGRGIGAQQSIKRRLANLERIRQDNPALAEVIENTGGFEALMIGAGEGLTDIGQAAGRLFGMLDAEDARDTPEFNALKTVKDSASVGEILGQSAPFLPFAVATSGIPSLTGRTLAMTGTGAVEGGSIASGQGGRAGEIAGGAILGGTLAGSVELALPVLNRAGRWLTEKLTGKSPEGPVFAADGTPAPQFQELLDENGIDVGDVERIAREVPEAAVDDVAGNASRQAAFEKLGITPTEAQRTRSSTLFREQQDLIREGDTAVRAAVEQQDEILSRAADVISESARGEARTADNAIDVVVNRSLKLDDEIGKLYQAAKEAAPNDPVVAMNGLAGRLSKLSGEDEFSSGVVSAVRSRMKEVGILDKKGNLVGREGIANTGNRTFIPQKISIVKAEKLRQYMNELYKDARGRGRTILTELKNSLDNDVFRAAGRDFFEQARAAKTSFERGLSKERLHKFDRSKTSLVRDILENNIAPEDLFNKSVLGRSKYKAADLKGLKDYLFSGSEQEVESGIKAWNNLRADALQHIKEVAFIGPETQSGSKSLSRAGLNRAFKSIGDAKARVLFSDGEMKFLRDLANVAALREPPPGTFMGSGPSGPAIRQLESSMHRIFGKFPVIGEFVTNTIDSIKTKRAEKRVLQLVDDAQKIEEQRIREAFQALRRSRIGESVSAAPVLLAPAASAESE